MSFGQQSGPPASAKQVAYLLSLLKKEGFESFRDARHSYGLTQRQAGGKFAGKEASVLIDRLLGNSPPEETLPLDLGARPLVPASAADEPEIAFGSNDAQAALIRGIQADVLADELRRRGWNVAEPA
jgi:hypothetical protein